MKNLLKLEELGQFLLAIVMFNKLEYAWWVFPLCILLPDVSAVGYLVNPKVGAWLYNFFHHKLVALIVLFVGYWLSIPLLTLAGIILFAHAAMDRIFGYGFKYSDNFKHTHLGWIGNNNNVKH